MPSTSCSRERPVLLVTTKPANKLSLFGEKLLRVYELERDRSRLGINPLFAVQSRMNIWQTALPLVLDVNADGHEDLVVAFWKGLMDDKVVLDVYLAEAGGWFRDTPRTTGFNVKNGERSFVEYGSDLTGNGFPDLLVGADGGLVLYPGLESSNGKKLVDKQRPYEVLRGGDSDDDDEVEVVISGDGMDTWQIRNSRVRPAVGRPRRRRAQRVAAARQRRREPTRSDPCGADRRLRRSQNPPATSQAAQPRKIRPNPRLRISPRGSSFSAPIMSVRASHPQQVHHAEDERQRHQRPATRHAVGTMGQAEPETLPAGPSRQRLRKKPRGVRQ